MSDNEILAAIQELRAGNWVPRVKPPKLRDTDIPRIGHRIRVGEDEIHAVMDVEAPRGGYDSAGRLVILYEPHVAYRCSSGAVRARLVAAGLAYPKWGQQPYPKNSYDRFSAAYAIDPEVAIKACSLGRAQILGENFAMCGFSSPIEMYVRLANGGEVAHLEAMVSFIISAKLDDELRAHNWAGFARGYNGPGYAKNAYDTKLAARFKWWSSKPDTPWHPGYVEEDADVEVVHPGEPVAEPSPPVRETPVPAPSPGPSIPGKSGGPITKPAESALPAPAKKSWWRWFGGIIDSIFYVDPTRPK